MIPSIVKTLKDNLSPEVKGLKYSLDNGWNIFVEKVDQLEEITNVKNLVVQVLLLASARITVQPWGRSHKELAWYDKVWTSHKSKTDKQENSKVMKIKRSYYRKIKDVAQKLKKRWKSKQK